MGGGALLPHYPPLDLPPSLTTAGRIRYIKARQKADAEHSQTRGNTMKNRISQHTPERESPDHDADAAAERLSRIIGTMLLLTYIKDGRIHGPEHVDAKVLADLYDEIKDEVTASDLLEDGRESTRYRVFCMDSAVRYAMATKHAPKTPTLVGDELVAMMKRNGRA